MRQARSPLARVWCAAAALSFLAAACTGDEPKRATDPASDLSRPGLVTIDLPVEMVGGVRMDVEVRPSNEGVEVGVDQFQPWNWGLVVVKSWDASGALFLPAVSRRGMDDCTVPIVGTPGATSTREACVDEFDPLLPPGVLRRQGAEREFLLIGGRQTTWSPSDMWTLCGGTRLSVDAGQGNVIRIGAVGEATLAEFTQVAELLSVVDGEIAVKDTAAAREVGRLPPDWFASGDGTRIRVGDRGQFEYLVRRVTEDEQELLLSLRCLDPVRDMGPPISESATAREVQRPATYNINGRSISVGLVLGVEVAIVAGEHGVVVLRRASGVRPLRELAEEAATATVVRQSELHSSDAP